jgi:hypothetical protein
MKRNKVFAIIVVLTLLVGAALSWLAVSHEHVAKIPHKALLIPLSILAVLAIYPLYRLKKSWPVFAWGINLVLASLLLTICSLVGLWIGFSGWSELLEDLAEALFFVGTVILVWRAATKKGQPNLKRE